MALTGVGSFEEANSVRASLCGRGFKPRFHCFGGDDNFELNVRIIVVETGLVGSFCAVGIRFTSARGFSFSISGFAFPKTLASFLTAMFSFGWSPLTPFPALVSASCRDLVVCKARVEGGGIFVSAAVTTVDRSERAVNELIVTGLGIADRTLEGAAALFWSTSSGVMTCCSALLLFGLPSIDCRRGRLDAELCRV